MAAEEVEGAAEAQMEKPNLQPVKVVSAAIKVYQQITH